MCNAIGRSRGGFSTKLHALVDTRGRPLHIALTPGQRHEMTMAPTLLQHASGKVFIGDTGYDSSALIEAIRDKGMRPVIHCKPERKLKRPLRKKYYRKRYLVEVFFHHLKRFRAIATRYDKTARNYLSLIHLACATLWLEN